MIELAVLIIPPAKGSPGATMSPTEFLVSTDILNSLKRKASLPEITPTQAKFLRLDPPPTVDDLTITHYYQRTNELIDRPGIQVMIPFEKAWNVLKLHLEAF